MRHAAACAGKLTWDDAHRHLYTSKEWVHNTNREHVWSSAHDQVQQTLCYTHMLTKTYILEQAHMQLNVCECQILLTGCSGCPKGEGGEVGECTSPSSWFPLMLKSATNFRLSGEVPLSPLQGVPSSGLLLSRLCFVLTSMSSSMQKQEQHQQTHTSVHAHTHTQQSIHIRTLAQT